MASGQDTFEIASDDLSPRDEQHRRHRCANTYEISSDDLWPRTPEFRFRVYMRLGDELRIVAAAGTAGGVGEAIVGLHEDAKEVGRRLADAGRLGVLDVLAGPKGEWVVLPFDRGGT